MSPLSSQLKNYLDLRTGLGFKMKETRRCLPRFVSFLQRHGAQSITTKMAVEWAVEPKTEKRGYWAQRLSMVRGFAKYLSGIDADTEVPPARLLPYGNRRRKPHIYTAEEIQRLLRGTMATDTKESINAKTYATIFGMLSVTGMRLGECLSLDDPDVNLDEGLLLIRGSKCRKARLVPIHPTAKQQLALYRRERDRLYAKRKTPAFFILDNGNRPQVAGVERCFLRIARRIGLRGPVRTKGPYLHDMRHTFAVSTLSNWYRSGLNVECRMPELSTYLGHSHVAYTYWYLSAEPELLALAAKRLDHAKECKQ